MACLPSFPQAAGRSLRLVLSSFVLLCAVVAARGYDTSPNRATRLSYIQGSVTVDRANDAGSEPGQLNMPLVQGQLINTGEDGQAEVEFEDGSLVRLTPYSSLSLDSLTADSDGNLHTQISVVSGLVYAELRATPKSSYRLLASGSAISPVENATFRVNMDQPPAVISVFSGAVYVEMGDSQKGYRREVRPGESLREDASSASGYFLTQLIQENSWDAWNEERDQRAAEQATTKTSARDSYAGEEGYGWSDLDANGTWYEVSGMGPVWQPSAALEATFDPYGYGSWVWYPATGYIWASGYAWGWTPFRCGKWSYWHGFGWGWMPSAGCGHCGWGAGNVFAVNIGHPPLGYHFHPLPGHDPSGLHPIVAVGTGRAPANQPQQFEGSRTIAGRTATPLPQVITSYASHSGSTVGAPLLRDFPIDAASHRPITGLVSTYQGSGRAYPGSISRNPPAYGQGSSMVARPPVMQPTYRPVPVTSYPVHPVPPAVHLSAPPAPHMASPPPSHAAPSAGSRTR